MSDERRPILIAGGGPGGAIAGIVLARAGVETVLFEREAASRFHVGESMLPRTVQQLDRLGLSEGLQRLPMVVKDGATFAPGSGAKASHIPFDQALCADVTTAFSLEREPFDEWLLQEAIDAGVDVRRGCRITGIEHLERGDVRLETDAGPVLGSCIVDATGQAAIVGRHLGQRRILPGLERVAYAAHATGIEREAMPEGGYTIICMFDEGWGWFIPLDEERTSIGVVLPPDLVRRHGVPPNQVLRWAIERTPGLRQRCVNATLPDRNIVVSDFSYTCAPFAGPGYYLVGDAASFLDPVFSGGVCLAMLTGEWAASSILAALDRPRLTDELERSYAQMVEESQATLFRMIEHYYTPGYRDLLYSGKGPLQVHRAVIEMLTGYGFPGPVWPVRWRLGLMDIFRRLQRYIPVVPRMETWSIETAEPDPLPDRPGMAGDLDADMDVEVEVDVAGASANGAAANGAAANGAATNGVAAHDVATNGAAANGAARPVRPETATGVLSGDGDR